MATETKSNKGGFNKTDQMRSRLAQLVLGACTLIAALLVLAAILVALRGSINATNDVVQLIKNIAKTFDGPLSRDSGVFSFDGKRGVTLDALVNWGIAAVVWLGIGKIASGLIRP